MNIYELLFKNIMNGYEQLFKDIINGYEWLFNYIRKNNIEYLKNANINK